MDLKETIKEPTISKIKKGNARIYSYKTMKAVILAGGYGTRLMEETEKIPKPMVDIGGKPILWHIMKIYSYYNINDFIICLGYKGYIIKEYFSNYFLHNSDVTFDFQKNKMIIHNNHCEPWIVTLIDTGNTSQTGGRLKRAKEYIGNETFCFTYGDGLSDINIDALVQFHISKKESGYLATITAVTPPGRYGALYFNGDTVVDFKEKPVMSDSWVNGGFFVLEPEVLEYIDGDFVSFEDIPMKQLAKNNKLNAYQHNGFWCAMDTLRDKVMLQKLTENGKPPWQKWD